MSNPSHREQRLARGRLLVAITIAAMLGFSMFVVALTLRAGTFGPTQAIRLSLTALLAYMLWQGRPWARTLTVVLAAITAVLFGIMAAEQAVDEGVLVAVVLSAVGAVVYGAVAATLGTSKSVKVFLERQRKRARLS